MLLSATNACEKNCSETLNVVSVLWFLYSHYANMSVQYTAIFHGYKNDYFQMKHCNIFLIFAQNIDCGYTLEPSHTASVRRF